MEDDGRGKPTLTSTSGFPPSLSLSWELGCGAELLHGIRLPGPPPAVLGSIEGTSGMAGVLVPFMSGWGLLGLGLPR